MSQLGVVLPGPEEGYGEMLALAMIAAGSKRDRKSRKNTTKTVTTVTQFSLFERLPPELRNLVYYYHFNEGKPLHLIRKHVYDPRHRRRNSEDIRNLTHILLVNKRIHAEAKPILFYKREFIFLSVTCLAFFAHSVAVKDRQLVRHISFDCSGVYAPKAFVALARFPAIETLKVVFSKLMVYREHWSHKALQHMPGIREFLQLRGIGKVEVVVTEKLDHIMNEATVARFKEDATALTGPWVDRGEKKERKGPLKAKMGPLEASM